MAGQTEPASVAVDAQFPDTAKACVEGLQQKAAKGIQLLINTHYHGDHTAGNSAFQPVIKADRASGSGLREAAS